MMHSRLTVHRHQKGISLLEILLALAIVAAVTIYLTKMVNFVESGNKVDQSFERMKRIVSQMKTYYASHSNLPDPAANPVNSVPVDNQQLNLAQKYRLDAWGQYVRYFRPTKLDAFSSVVITDIVGYQVNGRKAAGVLISLGPNQTKDYDDTTANVFISGGDDLLVPITVEVEAWQIVMTELDKLHKLVMTYDRVFAGIDNDEGDMSSDGGYIYSGPQDIYPPGYLPPGYAFGAPPSRDSFFLVDEDGCAPAFPNGCVFGLPTSGMTNDPNCGRATIDDCNNPVNAILTLYELSDPSYQTDPWGNLYQWGNGTTLLRGADDPRYHVFFSKGPDGDTTQDYTDDVSNDDITPY